MIMASHLLRRRIEPISGPRVRANRQSVGQIRPSGSHITQIRRRPRSFASIPTLGLDLKIPFIDETGVDIRLGRI